MHSAPNTKAAGLTSKTIFSKGVNRLSSIPGIVWLLPICAALLTTRYIFTSVDTSEYLVFGRMIADGHGYGSDLLGPQLDRGPMFSLIIAGVLHFWGLKLELIGYITRTFYMLDLLILYGIGSRLYGRMAGYFAFFLALTAFTIHKTSPYILLDHVLPFFILLAVLMTILAIQTTSAIFPFSAGASLGLAYLTKESALMYLPLLCLLLFQRRYSVKKRFIRTASAYISFGIVSAPWVFHIITYSKSFKDIAIGLMGGHVRFTAASGLGQSIETANLADRIISAVSSILHYNTTTVPHDFAIAPLFFIGVALLIITLLVRKRFTGVEVLLAALILTSPLNAYLGSHTMRTGQSITYYYLLLAGGSSIIGCCIAMLHSWKNRATHFPQLHKIAAWGVPVLLAITIISFQLHQEKGFIEALKGKGAYGLRYYHSPKMEITGIWGTSQIEAAKWVDERMAPNNKILASMTLWGPLTLGGLSKDQVRYILLHPGISKDPHDFELAGNSLPFLIINPIGDTEILTLDYQRKRFATYLFDNDRPLYVFTPPSLPSNTCIDTNGSIHSNSLYYCGIWFFMEKTFLKFLRDKDIQYIAISHTDHHLNEYLSRNKGFRLVFKADRPTGSVSIYRVETPQPLEQPFLMVNDQVPIYLERLKKYYPNKFERFRQEVLVDYLHLGPDKIHEILSGEGMTYKTY